MKAIVTSKGFWIGAIVGVVLGFAIGQSTPTEEPEPAAQQEGESAEPPTPTETEEEEEVSCSDLVPSDAPNADEEFMVCIADPDTYEYQEAAEAAEADGTFTSSCDYILGDHSESPSGYRFVGQAKMKNTGGVPITVEAVARWQQLGTAPITAKKRVRLDVGERSTARFTVPGTSDQIDLHQSIDSTDKCKVRVKIVDEG